MNKSVILYAVVLFFALLFSGCPEADEPDKPGNTVPEVVSIDPSDGTDSVTIDTNIIVTFSETMETSSTESAFSLTAVGGGACAGTFGWPGIPMLIIP